ncbi:hypothetical protein C8Q78DRAFT_345257 [Trametes maxima]|nr:hypothetical protein C8Q78DRAFT_345257 [Trametes maxima]
MPAWTKAQLSQPWPGPHDVQLESPGFYESAERTTGADNLDRHRPGNLVEPYCGEPNRRAGTYGMEGSLDWCEKLDRSDTFVSVRDVKTASTNYKLVHPRNHAFARYVLPVSESEIKNQKWPGRGRDKATLSSSPSASSISSGMASPGGTSNTGDDRSTDKIKSESSEAEQDFLDKLLAEMATVASFKNNSGRPRGELKFKCSEGHLEKKIMEQHFYPAGKDTAVFVCGPPGLIEKAALPGLKEMGFEDGKTIFGF